MLLPRTDIWLFQLWAAAGRWSWWEPCKRLPAPWAAPAQQISRTDREIDGQTDRGVCSQPRGWGSAGLASLSCWGRTEWPRALFPAGCWFAEIGMQSLPSACSLTLKTRTLQPTYFDQIFWALLKEKCWWQSFSSEQYSPIKDRGPKTFQ